MRYDILKSWFSHTVLLWIEDNLVTPQYKMNGKTIIIKVILHNTHMQFFETSRTSVDFHTYQCHEAQVARRSGVARLNLMVGHTFFHNTPHT